MTDMSRASDSVRSGRIVRDVVLTTSLSTVGRGVGFAIPFFVAAWFGVNTDTDAFFFAYGLVILLAGVFAPVVESVLVPFIAEIKTQDERRVRSFLGTTLVVATLGLAAVGALLVLVSRPVLSVVSNFPDESLDLIARLLLETVPLFVLLTATSLLSGALNAYKLFALPAVSPALRAAVALLIIFTFRHSMGVHSIALGYVVGEGVRLAVLLFQAAKKGVAPSLTSLALDSRLLQFLKTASYQIVGMAVLAFNPVIDKTMASWLAPGSVSILEYANRLYEIPIAFVTRGVFVVLLSHWSARFYEGFESGFRRNVVSTARLVGGGAALLSVVLILLRVPLVGLVYGHGEFPEGYLPTVYTVWAFYLVGLGPTLFGRVFGRAHLVLKNTRLLMTVGIVNVLLKTALNLALIRPLGLSGLALSTTITSSGLAVVLMLWFLKTRETGPEAGDKPRGPGPETLGNAGERADQGGSRWVRT